MGDDVTTRQATGASMARRKKEAERHKSAHMIRKNVILDKNNEGEEGHEQGRS